MRAHATVVVAGLPPLNATARHWGDWVFAVTDFGSGPTLVHAVVGLDRDRWLVPGQAIVLDIDPARLDRVHAFTVDWASVPPIRDRVAANDPTLATPIAARADAAERARTAARPPTAMSPGLGGGYQADPCSGPRLDARWVPSYEEAVRQLPARTPPAGRVPAVAVVTAMRMMFSDLSHDLHGRPNPDPDDGAGLFRMPMGGNEVVFAVATATRPPYAVFVAGFHSPRKRPLYSSVTLYPWLPATVALADPNDVRIDWDDVPDRGEKLNEMIGDAYRAQAASTAALTAQWQAAAADAMRGYQAPAPPAGPPASGGAALPPEAHQAAAMLAAQLRMVPPAMRAMIVEQSRAGLHVLPPEQR